MAGSPGRSRQAGAGRPPANGQQDYSAGYEANGQIPCVGDQAENSDLDWNLYVDDEVAASINVSQAMQQPCLASFASPFTSHLARQGPRGINEAQLMLGSSSSNAQPGNRRLPQDQEWWQRILRGQVQAPHSSPGIAPRAGPGSSYNASGAGRGHIQHTVQLPFDTGAYEPRGVRRNASQIEDSVEHFARGPPPSSFTYAENSPHHGATRHLSNQPHLFSNGLPDSDLPDFTSDKTGFIAPYSGPSQVQSIRDTPQASAIPDFAHWSNPTGRPMPDLNGAPGPLSDAQDNALSGTQQQHSHPDTLHWTTPRSFLLENPNTLPFSDNTQHRYIPVHGGQGSGSGASQRPRQQSTTPTGYGNTGFSSSGFQPFGSMPVTQSMYTSAFVRTATSHPNISRAQSPGSLVTYSPYVTHSPTTPSLVIDLSSERSSFDDLHRHLDRSLPGTNAKDALVQASRRIVVPHTAPRRGRSNLPSRIPLTDVASEAFTSPYFLPVPSRVLPANATPSSPSVGPSSSAKGFSMSPFGYAWAGQEHRNATSGPSHPCPRPDISSSPYQPDEQQGYPGLTSQGQIRDNVLQQVESPSAPLSTQRHGIDALTSRFASRGDSELGDIPEDILEQDGALDTNARFVSSFESHQDPSLIFQDSGRKAEKKAISTVVSKYEDFHAEVSLYEIVPETTGCYWAQAWLDNITHARPLSSIPLPARYPSPGVRSSFVHHGEGFIRNGNSLSLIVIHNATDPWSCNHEVGTTTVGVYPYHWYLHSWIHWTTFSPNLRAWFSLMASLGHIRLVQHWVPAMPPSERRFHRAYWLAANRLPLSTLLRQAPIENPVDPDRVEEEKTEEFEWTEDDLDGECGGVSAADARDAWDLVIGVTEKMGSLTMEYSIVGDPEAHIYDPLTRQY